MRAADSAEGAVSMAEDATIRLFATMFARTASKMKLTSKLTSRYRRRQGCHRADGVVAVHWDDRGPLPC